MLIPKTTFERISRGEITVLFRQWRKATVKAGGTLRTEMGELQIESIEPIEPTDITSDDALQSGMDNVAEVQSCMACHHGGQLYRIRVRFVGPDPRIALRQCDQLSAQEVDELRRKLRRLDNQDPWTERVLRLIQSQPGNKASHLAQELGMETEDLKIKVRKLKNLGLTESLNPGYQISPRGVALLRQL